MLVVVVLVMLVLMVGWGREMKIGTVKGFVAVVRGPEGTRGSVGWGDLGNGGNDYEDDDNA